MGASYHHSGRQNLLSPSAYGAGHSRPSQLAAWLPTPGCPPFHFICLQYGGAKYIPTGRGYAIKHNTFVKVGLVMG